MPLLKQHELDELTAVIADVERTTAGELRLIIARRSSVNNHVFPLLTAVFAMLGLIYLWYTRHLHMLGDTTWLLPMVIGGAFVAGFALSRLAFVQRAFTLPADLDHQVNQRAELEFHREGLGRTADRTGILIFLSVFERECVVLADQGIAAKLDVKVWQEVVDEIIAGVKTRRLRASLESAIRRCGRLLAEHFPVKPGDKNELPNHVLLK